MKFKSDVWKHYTCVTGSHMAICKKCPQEISYKGGSTSGLNRHLLQHGIGEPSEPQPLERVPMTDELKEKLDNSVAEFIITDFQPFHVVEAPAFRKMVTKLNPQYSPPHRTSITKRVLNVCHEVESNVRREIRQLQLNHSRRLDINGI